MACACGPGQQCETLKPGCWGYGATLKTEPAANWNGIWVAMQELGAAMGPLMELESPPSWAVSLRFVMDVALSEVEDLAMAAEQ